MTKYIYVGLKHAYKISPHLQIMLILGLNEVYNIRTAFHREPNSGYIYFKSFTVHWHAYQKKIFGIFAFAITNYSCVILKKYHNPNISWKTFNQKSTKTVMKVLYCGTFVIYGIYIGDTYT